MMVKHNRAIPGWWRVASGCFLLVTILVSLAGCAQATTSVPTQIQPQAATATTAPTATDLPLTATPTQAPTATATLLPTATALPTATPVPPLAVTDDGFNAWCAPVDHAGFKAEGPDAPEYARKLTKTNGQLQVTIPAAFCALSVRLNQPAPEGMKLRFMDGKNNFLELPLAKASQVGVAWATVEHLYVINPPLWEVVYTLVVLGPDGKELWSNPVKFAKPLPETCPFGGLPDPVTLWCAKTDPWEIEPHPDVVYPYDRSRFLTPQPGE